MKSYEPLFKEREGERDREKEKRWERVEERIM